MRILLSLLNHKNVNIVIRVCRILSRLTSEATETNPKNLIKYRKWVALDGGLDSLRVLLKESSDLLVENVVYCMSHLLQYLNPHTKVEQMEIQVKEETPTREPARHNPKFLHELCIFLAHRNPNVVAALCWIILQLQEDEKTRHLIVYCGLKQFLGLLRIESPDHVVLGVCSNLGPLSAIALAQPAILEHLRYLGGLLHHPNRDIQLQVCRVLLVLATKVKANVEANRRIIAETPGLLKVIVCLLWSTKPEDQDIVTICSSLVSLIKPKEASYRS